MCPGSPRPQRTELRSRPSLLIAASGPRPINCRETAEWYRARTGTTITAWCHNHRPRPRRAPGLPHRPPEPFAFPLPPRFRPGCPRPQPGPLPGREARAAACAGAPPSPHPPGQRGAPAGKESRAEPPSALPRSVPAGLSAASPAASARRCPGPRRHLVVFWGGPADAPLPAAAPSSCPALTGMALRAHSITGSLSLGKTCEIIEFDL